MTPMGMQKEADEDLDPYVRIYLDSDVQLQAVIEAVADAADGLVSGNTVLTEHAELFVFTNVAYSAADRNREADGFLYYRYELSIEPHEGANLRPYITWVGQLLSGLWAAGFRAVASCEFEELLPRQGQS
jgi:hypothetical protein